ncbi:helix-turn-helix domain-containing protein [Streptomyces decoyicus]|uniref:helix-turn-helix domain-containing protein n=1 Tax=Streptomyces decoyicus TaxID=249567 RepID=UPI002E17D69C
MPEDRPAHIGALIEEQRKLGHFTQRALAERAHVSFSLYTKVATGKKPASPSFIAACARALGVESSVLLGQPYASEQRAERFDAPLAALRASLENWDLPLDDGVPLRPLSALAGEVHGVGAHRRSANYLKVASEAPALIDELVEASHQHSGLQQERAHQLLAYLYRCVYDVAYKLGHIDMGSIILARMLYSAERSADPYMVMLTSYLRAQSCFSTGRHEVGLRLMERSLADVEASANAGEQPALCVQGNLRLRAAVLAARGGRAEQARAEVAEAMETAKKLGGETSNYVLSFGPSNTKIHGVAVEVEVGEYGEAIRLARKLTFPADFVKRYPDRVGHHFIDLSRAQLWQGDRDGALISLRKARKAAPQQARFHPHARETVVGLRRAARQSSDTLESFAHWMGV